MTAKNRLITPEGTKDYLFEEVRQRRLVEATLNELLTSQGFFEVQTPTLEFLDVFDVKGHSIPVEYMYKLTDNKGRLMVMRPDTTMPIARLMATRLQGAYLPIRLFYNQAIYSSMHRNGSMGDEITQMGIELIGNTSLKSDIEVITTATNALEKLKQKSFRLEIGHIGIFNTLVQSLQIDDSQKEEIRLLIESKNYPALNDLLDSFGNSYEVKVLKQLPKLFGDESVFDKAYELITDEKTVPILDYLKNLYQKLKKISKNITVDLGLVNRTDYYTGVVFKGYIEGFGEEVLSGGRYDDLLSKFDKSKNIGAIGFAINIDALTKKMLQNSQVILQKPKIIVFGKQGFEIEAISHLRKLIDEKIKCEYSVFDTLEETIELAKKVNIKQVDVIGETCETITIDKN
ncbi:MAG: ATP phosphoribosyltransferase regulatory subunit [Oscillospiraceae bacterium]